MTTFYHSDAVQQLELELALLNVSLRVFAITSSSREWHDAPAGHRWGIFLMGGGFATIETGETLGDAFAAAFTKHRVTLQKLHAEGKLPPHVEAT